MSGNRPHQMQTQALAGLRLRAASFAFIAAFCLADVATAAPPVKPNPALVGKAQTAKDALAQLSELRHLVHSAQERAKELAQTGSGVRTAWSSYQQTDAGARNAIQLAQECLPGLQQRLDNTSDAMVQLRQSTEGSQQAVKAIAQAQAGGLVPAAQSADQSFQKRAVAERRLKQSQQDLANQAGRCGDQTRLANGSSERAQRRALDFVAQARQVAPLRATLQADWQAAASAAQRAQRGGLLRLPPIPPLPDARRDTERLAQALADLPWPAGQRALSVSTGASLISYGPDPVPRLAELARLQDATAYIELATESAGGDCEKIPCADFVSERRELALRTVEAQGRVEQTLAPWRQMPASMHSALDSQTAALQTTATELDNVAQTWVPGTDETNAIGEAIARATNQQLPLVEKAQARAQQAWETAFLLAYGVPPPIAMSAGQDVDPPSPSPAPPAMGASAAPRTRIQSHAYELFSAFDGEATDFGAYTYVLLRSDHDMETPAVRRRFLQLLGSLQKLPAARLVARDQTRQVNVFCVPVKPGSEDAARASDVAYASDLGQQLKMRAQNGLLTRKEVHHRLTTSPGPFLITLPVRMALATSETPVLFADLSSYPDDTIADLANHYMNGLVDDFPQQQLLWKPPVLQRVALFMIHLAAGTGQMVSTVMPTAQAAPR